VTHWGGKVGEERKKEFFTSPQQLGFLEETLKKTIPQKTSTRKRTSVIARVSKSGLTEGRRGYIIKQPGGTRKKLVTQNQRMVVHGKFVQHRNKRRGGRSVKNPEPTEKDQMQKKEPNKRTLGKTVGRERRKRV